MNVCKLLKKRKQSKEKVMVHTSLEHMTLPLLAPRSTDWANRPFDINILQNNVLNATNVRKLLEKRKNEM